VIFYFGNGGFMSGFQIKLKGIVKYQDKYLLVKKWYDDRITDPYQWEFVDTSLEPGSDPEETILEAVSNATGLTIHIDKILYTWTYDIAETHYLGIAYQCNADDDTVFMSEDINSYLWVEKDKLGDYIENKRLLNDALEGINR